MGGARNTDRWHGLFTEVQEKPERMEQGLSVKKKKEKPRLGRGKRKGQNETRSLKGEGSWEGVSHLPWSKPQFGVKEGKQSPPHLESRLLAGQALSPKMNSKICPPVRTLENSCWWGWGEAESLWS